MILKQLIIIIIQGMSIAKERIKSANITSKPNPHRRYERINTQSSQSFKQQLPQKMRSQSKEWSKGKGVKVGKQKQQLAEQNLNLKSFINNLQEQLSLKRSQLQMSKKKTVKYAKQFNREFEKELYYSGKNPSSYLFSGIKQQYQNIKNLYHQKCEEINILLQQPTHTELQQLAILNEELLRQNYKLRQKIQMSFSHQDQQQDDAYFEVIEKAKAKVALRDHEIEELKKKVNFLQKLVIQKDNNQHQARRNTKNLDRNRKALEIQILQLRKQVGIIKESNERRIQALLDTSGKKIQMEALVFRNALRDKDQMISKLEKQVRYLSTLLSYWKPLDQIQQSRQYERQASLDSPLIRFNTNDRVRLDSLDQQHQVLSSHQYQRYEREKSMKGSSKDEELSSIRKSVGGIHNQSQQAMVIKNCATKHGQSSVKCRRVELRQVKGISELLRYRLIGQKVSMQMVKQLLDQNNLLEDSGLPSQYISMREVKNILMESPFGLSQPDANLFSRYVVQDQPGEYVYSDDENQIKRSIAKSIFRATIEEYSIPEESIILAEWEKLKSTYLPNIQSALKVIAPTGLISQAKFVELLVGLGIEMKDELKDWMIASMVINSKSLKELCYRFLIPQ